MKRILTVAVILLALCICLTGCFASKKDEIKKESTTTTLSKLPPLTPTTVSGATSVLSTTATTSASGNDKNYPCVAYATDSLNVRRSPNLDYDAIGGLSSGDQVTIIGKEGDFYKIEWHSVDGAYTEDYAYVSAQYITLKKGESVTTTTALVSDPTTTHAN